MEAASLLVLTVCGQARLFLHKVMPNSDQTASPRELSYEVGFLHVARHP